MFPSSSKKPKKLTWLWWFLDPYKSESLKAFPPPSDQCQRLSLHHIQTATNNFSHPLTLENSSSDKVYKGYIDDWDMTVAIKCFKEFRAEDFQTKFHTMSQLRHRNLVSMVGYCDDKDEMIAVYEFMDYGNLSDNLYSPIKDQIPWNQRLEICICAARGLDYIHSREEDAIIHGNIKPSKIFLDNKFKTKISDIEICGGIGESMHYIAPEFMYTNRLTEKSDVYSFGVVLFEVICGLKPFSNDVQDRKEDWMSILAWTQYRIEEGNFHKNVDLNLRGTIAPLCLKKFVEVATSCVSFNDMIRPSMREVVDALEDAREEQRWADIVMEEVFNPREEYTYPDRLFNELDLPHIRFMDGHISPKFASEISDNTELSDNTSTMTMARNSFESLSRIDLSNEDISLST